MYILQLLLNSKNIETQNINNYYDIEQLKLEYIENINKSHLNNINVDIISNELL